MTASTREPLDLDETRAFYAQNYGEPPWNVVQLHLSVFVPTVDPTDALPIVEDALEAAGLDIRATPDTDTHRLIEERDTLRACITAITAAWWSATEPTDTGYTYTDDTDKTMATIWDALAAAASAEAAADGQAPTRRAPHELPKALAEDESDRVVARVAKAVFERTGSVSWAEAQRDAREQFLADAEVAVSTVLEAMAVGAHA